MPEQTRFERPRHPRFRVMMPLESEGKTVPHYITRTERVVPDQALAWESTRLEDSIWQMELLSKTYSTEVYVQEQTRTFGEWVNLSPMTLIARASKTR